MADDDLRTATEQFIKRTDVTLSEYDEGFTDADAALRIIRSHLDDLREAVEE